MWLAVVLTLVVVTAVWGWHRYQQADFRQQKLTQSAIRRWIRWEYWPIWFFYLPIVGYILYLAVRYRSPLAFAATNPGMTNAGMYGEDKSLTLLKLAANAPEFVADLAPIDVPCGKERVQRALEIMDEKGWDYPVILKPEKGCRGQDVQIISDRQQLICAVSRMKVPAMLQQYISGREFGVFFVKPPERHQGFVFSITEKTFPVITGDGEHTLEYLILTNPRTNYLAAFLLTKFQSQLDRVLARDETLSITEVGSHCRGSVFLDANHLNSPQLTRSMETITRAIPGFYFGRFDLRVEPGCSLSDGTGIKVIEVNGVTSEAAHIYDPSNSFWTAWKVMFEQWRWAFIVGQQNLRSGEASVSFRDFFRELNRQRQPF